MLLCSLSPSQTGSFPWGSGFQLGRSASQGTLGSLGRGSVRHLVVWRPGMLPNILPCIEQPPTTRPYPAPNVSSAEAEKPALGQAVSSHSRKLSCEGVETGTLASLFHRGGQRLKGRKQLVEEGVASSFSQHIFIKYLLYASYYSNCRTETRAHFFYSFSNRHFLRWLLGICSDESDPAPDPLELTVW